MERGYRMSEPTVVQLYCRKIAELEERLWANDHTIEALQIQLQEEYEKCELLNKALKDIMEALCNYDKGAIVALKIAQEQSSKYQYGQLLNSCFPEEKGE